MKVIFPPRPTGKIHWNQLDKLESRNKYLAQRKFRGNRNLIHRTTDNNIQLYCRHGRGHLSYKMPNFLKEELMSLNFKPNTEYWLDSELMNPRITDTIILFDVLHADKYLYGVKQTRRLELLDEICWGCDIRGRTDMTARRSPKELARIPIALKVTEHIWLAEFWTSNFKERFDEALSNDLIEGLVLRESDSILDNFGSKEYECSWQLRVRKPGPNYAL